MKKIKALIVDDEQAARNSLSNFLIKYCPHVELVGMADNINSACELIEKEQPDLVYLDIEMPHGNGFDLFDKLKEVTFETIFVTAFSQYAIQAFNLSAAHYLLKPVDIDELVEATNKVTRSIESKDTIISTSILLENLKLINNQKRKVVIPLMEGFEVVKMEDILYMIADDNFVHIHTIDQNSFMACRSLKFYEEQLTDAGFLRIHRKYMVNLDKVVRFLKGKSGFVVMENGKELELSASKRKIFLSKFMN